MSSGTLSNVAIIGSGISGAVCASILAASGVSVTVFEAGRGAGGRMSQRRSGPFSPTERCGSSLLLWVGVFARNTEPIYGVVICREMTEDGRDLFFDHGAPYFSVTDKEVAGLVNSWQARGLLAEWRVPFGCFDRNVEKFVDLEKEGMTKYVGVPGMNSICKALISEPGIEAKFGVTIGKMSWLCERDLWSLIGLDGQDLGQFDGVVASDKNVISSRFTGVTGKPPPLDIASSPDLSILSQDIPVRPCFALMLAFSEPLSLIPVKGFSFKNSEVLSWAYCDSSKPGRSRAFPNCECWVLHSTTEFAEGVIARTGLKKLSNEALAKVAEELFQEFQATGISAHPVFLKAHRWGSAFPAITVGEDDKCLWDKNRRLAICGDFCAGPNVEGAILSGIRAASKMLKQLVTS